MSITRASEKLEREKLYSPLSLLAVSVSLHVGLWPIAFGNSCHEKERAPVPETNSWDLASQAFHGLGTSLRVCAPPTCSRGREATSTHASLKADDPLEESGNLIRFHYFCLENPMGGEAW